MTPLNETHDPNLKSWVDSAQDSEFPVQNLPFGVFSPSSAEPRIGVAIGDRVLDAREWAQNADLSETIKAALSRPTLNGFMSLGQESWSLARLAISRALRQDGDRSAPLYKASDCKMHLPADIGDYTDFYASIYHATNVGALFRPDNPLLPNYKHIPIAYHGRASSIVPSGTPIKRPKGQTKADDAESPSFGPSRVLDYELEMGAFIGPGNQLGEPIDAHVAEDHLFGLCLLNDWSARDLQKWEYQPLGPFLAKNFASTISPWIVTTEALAPFRCDPFQRPEGDPLPLDYLLPAGSGFDIHLEAQIAQADTEPMTLCRSNSKWLYWTIAQMIAHHTSNGCNLKPGDLIGTGTISGPDIESLGSLLELTRGGKQPFQLPNGESRRFLEDGDRIVLRARCERQGFASIGFGECSGEIVGA